MVKLTIVEAHVGHVASGDFLDLRGESVAILINLLDRHRAQDRAQVPLERLHGDVLDGVGVLAEKLLRRGRDGNVVALDLDLRDPVDLHRHALAGVDLGRVDIDREQLERKDVGLLDHRHDESAAALDDAEAAHRGRPVQPGLAVPAPGDDQHLVGADLGVAAGPDGNQAEQDHDHDDHGHGDFAEVGGKDLGEDGGMHDGGIYDLRFLIYDFCPPSLRVARSFGGLIARRSKFRGDRDVQPAET